MAKENHKAQSRPVEGIISDDKGNRDDDEVFQERPHMGIS